MSGSPALKGFVASEDLPPRIVGYLNAAASSRDWRDAESLLLRAQATDPDCLQGELDPDDTVGASVIASYAAGAFV